MTSARRAAKVCVIAYERLLMTNGRRNSNIATSQYGCKKNAPEISLKTKRHAHRR